MTDRREPRTEAGKLLLAKIEGYMSPKVYWYAADAVVEAEDEAAALREERLRDALEGVMATWHGPYGPAQSDEPCACDAHVKARAALATEGEPTMTICGCKADTELGAANGCSVCGHRDHGASGCRAALATEGEPTAPEVSDYMSAGIEYGPQWVQENWRAEADRIAAIFPHGQIAAMRDEIIRLKDLARVLVDRWNNGRMMRPEAEIVQAMVAALATEGEPTAPVTACPICHKSAKHWHGDEDNRVWWAPTGSVL